MAKKKTKKEEQAVEPVANCDQFTEVVANCDRFKSLKHSTTTPYAFTVYGVSMLPSVLTNERAIDTSIRIIDAFVAMRKFLIQNASILMRIAHLERHQIETDEKIDAILDKMEQNSPKMLPEQIFPIPKSNSRNFPTATTTAFSYAFFGVERAAHFVDSVSAISCV